MDKETSGGTGLETHVAGTLCYVGGWVSGLILLLLETRNRVVRFHAMQSIVIFGTFQVLFIILSLFGSLFSLSMWGGALAPASVVFTILWSLVLAFSIVLWLLLIVRTYHKQQVLVPLAGDVAFWLLHRFNLEAPEREAMAFQGLGGELPARGDHRPHRARWEDSAATRAISSVVVIVWSIVLFVLFNFYADYIAFYHSSTEGGVTQMLRYPIFNAELARALPIFNVSLGLNVLGHLLALAWNRYLLREVIEVVLHAFAVVVAAVFMRVFPFDYSGLPIDALVTVLPTLTVVIIALVIVGNVIETIVHTVRLITGIVTR